MLITLHAAGAAAAEPGFRVDRYLFLETVLQELRHREVQMSLHARQSVAHVRIDLCTDRRVYVPPIKNS